MGFIEETFVKAKEVFDVAGKKTSEVITVQKLKVNAASLESQIARDFEALGRLIYADSRENGNSGEAAEELMTEIDGKRIHLESLQAEIAHMKGNRICRSCGSANAPGATFCSRCGEKLGMEKAAEPNPTAEETNGEEQADKE